jgi:hypothetical protein
MNSRIVLRNPGGGVALETFVDRVEFQLTSTGTWTIEITDFELAETGTYVLSLLELGGTLTNADDPDGGPIASNTTIDGSTQSICDFDAYTFTGGIGERVLVAALATAGASFNTTISIYPPGGGAAEATTGGDRLDHQLLASGTYTIVVEDAGDDHTGGYTLSLLELTAGPLTTPADPDGGAIASNEIKPRSFQTLGDFDAYHFMGTFGQRVIVTAVATGGAANTNLALYPPGGGQATVFTSSDRVDYQLTATGLWTIVVEDLNDDQTGTYTLSYYNVTVGPFTTGADDDGGSIVSNGSVNRSIQSVGDIDAWEFGGTAGERVLFAALATSGASFNTTMSIYPPGGGAAEITTSGDRIDHQLLATGTYKLVIEDSGLDHTGAYALSFVNLTAGPWTSAGDPDGGSIATGAVRAGTTSPAPDFDAFRFGGTIGDTAFVSAVATGGAMNTHLALYPPGGGPAAVFTSSDAVQYVLPVSGLFTLVVEDLNDDQTGTYALNFTKSGSTVGVPGGLPGDGAVPLDATRVVLRPAVPSPFAQATSLAFSLPAPREVVLALYDVRGARVRTLVAEARPAGVQRVAWDGRDDAGRAVAAGVYVARLEAGEETVVRKVVRLR